MQQPFIDIQQMRAWWEIERDRQLTEIRLIAPDGTTWSGYYTDFDRLVADVSQHPECAVYATINRINPALHSRQQSERLVRKPKNTTADADIVGRDMVVIDIDARRPAGVNASDEELEYTKRKCNEVFKFLRDMGFSAPCVALSGNGCHLRFKCAIANDPESNQMIKDFLCVLDSMFSDEAAEIDTSVFNPARILKVPGTPSRKGSDTPERPQRMSAYVRIPDDFAVTPRQYFEKVAAMKPQPEKPSRQNKFNSDPFDLQQFIARHGIQVQRAVATNSGTRYILKQCVFNPQHTAPDAMIFQGNDGTLGYHCFHQSCSTHSWSDVRMLFEPDRYTRAAQEDFRYRQRYYGSYDREPFIPKPENERDGKIWLQHSDVRYTPPDMDSYIPLGYPRIDRRLFGLLLGDVTIISGKNASGKTVFIDNVILNMAAKGWKVAVWSGELQPQRFFGWIDLIAAGRAYVTKKDGYENFYYVQRSVSEKIGRWMDGKVFLFNNNYRNNYLQIFHNVQEIVEREGVRCVVLDNMAALDISELDGDKLDRQKKFIAEIKEYAKQRSIHIIVVAHPKKTKMVIRRDDVSGTGDLTNLVDNCILIHKNNRDFEIAAPEFFNKDVLEQLKPFSTVVEISKNRDRGLEDVCFGLYYELETKRLKQEISDCAVYGWNEAPSQMSIPIPSPPTSPSATAPSSPSGSPSPSPSATVLGGSPPSASPDPFGSAPADAPPF